MRTELARPTAPPERARRSVVVKIADLDRSLNHRTAAPDDGARIEELAQSIMNHGVLEPIIVRPIVGQNRLAVVAGFRRTYAAQLAGLEEIPASEMELSDVEALEIQIVENLQRAGVHPLDEAAAFGALMELGGYDVYRVATRVGRPVAAIYEIVGLRRLTAHGAKLFRDGWITLGHAIQISRLSERDQGRALEAVLEDERLLWDPSIEKDAPGRKAISVAELRSWINAHVRLEATQVDQMILPETAARLEVAATEKIPVLRITHDVMTPAEGAGGPLVLGRSWQRADGERKSKRCEHARLALVVVGPDRGAAFLVCVNKKGCTIHWPDHVKALRKARKATGTAKKTGADPAAARRAAEDKVEEDRKRRLELINAARPQMVEALVARLQKAAAGPATVVGHAAIAIARRSAGTTATKEAAGLKIATAEDIVRFIVLGEIVGDMTRAWDGKLSREAVLLAQKIGVDLRKILRRYETERAKLEALAVPTKKAEVKS